MKCRACSKEIPDGTKFCPECGANLRGGTARRYPEKSESQPTSQAFLSEERRTVTVLFADIKGFTKFSESRDPEEVADIVESLFKRLAAVVESHGGHVDKYIGDAIMAVFGVPTSHEDDPARAVLCGIKIQEEMEKFRKERGMSLQLRVGINTGEVIWGELTGGARTVIGDTVNVAQRMESMAEPGSIVVGSQTRELAAAGFDFRKLAVTQVKGRTQAVSPYQVVSERHDGPFGGKVMPCVGREEELRFLMNAYERVLTEHAPLLVIVSGEPGSGKNRFYHAFGTMLHSRHETIRVRFGRCASIGGDPFATRAAPFLRRLPFP
jgi:class 3 adenylate cyclase